MSKTRVQTTWQTFITTWQNADSAEEAADQLGIQTVSAQARASKYRSKGVALKTMSRKKGGPRSQINYEELKKYADNLA